MSGGVVLYNTTLYHAKLNNMKKRKTELLYVPECTNYGEFLMCLMERNIQIKNKFT